MRTKPTDVEELAELFQEQLSAVMQDIAATMYPDAAGAQLHYLRRLCEAPAITRNKDLLALVTRCERVERLRYRAYGELEELRLRLGGRKAELKPALETMRLFRTRQRRMDNKALKTINAKIPKPSNAELREAEREVGTARYAQV